MKLNFINRFQYDKLGNGYTSSYKDADGDWIEFITPKGREAIQEIIQTLQDKEMILFAEHIQKCVLDQGKMTKQEIATALNVWKEINDKT
jgi:hypothetical protein